MKGNTPSILGVPVRMLQTYGPCNLMSNPSSIKFLSTRGDRCINKKKAQRNKIIKMEKQEILSENKQHSIFYVTHLNK
jgi:hypothetical protein